MRIALVSLIGLLVFADDGDWARRLASDDPAEREKAVADLEALGDDAAPIATRLLESDDAEVAGRAREVLAWLEHTASARRLLAIAGRFSIDVPRDAARPIPEVLREVGTRFGLEVEIDPKVSERRWSGSIQDLKLLQILDRLSADIGVAYAVSPGWVELFDGRPAAAAARDYPGPFRVSVCSVSCQSGYDATWDRWSSVVVVGLGAIHEMSLLEVPPSAIEVDLAEYDTGELVDVGALRRADPHPFHGRDGMAAVRLPNAPSEAKGLKSLRGRLVLDAPTRYDTWRFEEVAKDATLKTDAGRATILAVQRYTQREAECVSVYVRMTGARFGDHRIPGVGAAGTISLLGADGRPAPTVRWWPAHHSWTGHYQTLECEARFAFPSNESPSKLVVRVPSSSEPVELPFEIRDIPFRP